MDIKEDNFPLYRLLLKLDNPGVANAKADFEAASKGGDDDKYRFALGMQQIALNVPKNLIPGFTPDLQEKELRSCLAVFKDVASRGHANAAVMVSYFRDHLKI